VQFEKYVQMRPVGEPERQRALRYISEPELARARMAPPFAVDTLDGQHISLDDLTGKVVLIDFWATWCGPCRAEIPDLVGLQNKYKDRLQILGLVVDDDDQDAIKDFVEKFDINYPVAIATNDIRMQYGGIAALPTSFVLDAEGRIVQKHEGLRDPVLYETEVRALLGLPIGNVKVETFEDTGQIFLKHAERATELPGVDLSKLTPEQKISALHKFNAETCNCGCTFTLAQCRIYDRNCQISKAATAKIVAALAHPAPTKSATPAAPPAPAPSTQPVASPSPGKPRE
jgi:thiol-disulfide isomerase/thioredoxin